MKPPAETADVCGKLTSQSMIRLRKLNDPVLNTPAQPFTEAELGYSYDISKLISLLREKMYEFDGVGLAAPQIGISRAAFAYDDREGHKGVIFNPTITHLKEIYPYRERSPEGCLSIPGHQYSIYRYKKVRIEGYDITATPVVVDAQGLLARIFQHEVDHLSGKLYISYLPKDVRLQIIMESQNAATEKERN